MHYWIIIYACCPCFRFPPRSLLFTSNPGHYTPNSSCSSTNSLNFTLDFLSGYVPVSAIPPIRLGGGGGCARKARCANMVGGVDSNEWVCLGVRETILAQDIYCEKFNPKLDSQYSSLVYKGLGTQSPWSIQEFNLTTAITIRPLIQPLTWKWFHLFYQPWVD